VTAVNLSGTFAKDERPYNGLEEIADQLIDDEFGTHYVISRIKPHGYSKKPGEPMSPTVKLEHIEVVTGEDADWVTKKLDELYQARTGREDAPPKDLFDTAGERAVPEASGEEIMAEREEAKAAEAGEG
jgi:hypothetical protein